MITNLAMYFFLITFFVVAVIVGLALWFPPPFDTNPHLEFVPYGQY